MKTPEGKLKDQVKQYLKQLDAYFFQPVQMGMGMQTLDFLCCVPKGRFGFFVGIETKAPGKKPTLRQALCMQEIKAAGGIAFWCDSFTSFELIMKGYGFVPPAKP